MIPRWFRPSFWREQSLRVESMADPAKHRDPTRALSTRTNGDSGEQA